MGDDPELLMLNVGREGEFKEEINELRLVVHPSALAPYCYTFPTEVH